MEKYEILSNLYSLRAGIGELYVNNKKYLICDYNLANNEFTKKKKNCIGKIDKLKAEIKEHSDYIDNESKKYESEVLELQKEVDKYENKTNFDLFKEQFTDNLIATLFFTICAGLIGLILKWIFSTWIPLFILLGLAIIFIILGVSSTIDVKTEKNRAIRKVERKTKEFSNSIQKDIDTVKSEEEDLTSLKKELLTYIKAEEENKTRLNEEISILEKKLCVIKQSLDMTFGQLIDERDWKNLDLIIFYFETGRAITIREALLLADQQRQTNQIVNAINEASRSICLTINTSLNNLGDRIDKSITYLNDSITTLENQKFAKLSSINKSIIDQTEKIKINTETLRDTISISSNEMAESINKTQIIWANKY